MNSAQRIISKFGGQTALADVLGKKPSTVQYWAKAGRIPTKWQGTILRAAHEHGIEVYPGDFMDDIDPLMSANPDEDPTLPIAQWPGMLPVGGSELAVYVLNDGRRVISRTGATDALTGRKGGGNLESYLKVEALKGYLPEDILEQWIEFQLPGVVNKTVQGMTAETFLDICTAYVSALDAGALQTDRQRAIAIKASMFLAACSKLGLVALIDEVTGYQYARAEDALQFKLRLFLEEEMRKWENTFPDELWREFGRLTNWRGPIHQRPRYWGQLVMQLIYEYLDPDVAEWLKTNNPRPQKGQNHHQWLTSQYGLKKLTEHIWMVIGLAKASNSMSELKTRMAQLYGRQPVQITMFLPPPSNPAKAPASASPKKIRNNAPSLAGAQMKIDANNA